MASTSRKLDTWQIGWKIACGVSGLLFLSSIPILMTIAIIEPVPGGFEIIVGLFLLSVIAVGMTAHALKRSVFWWVTGQILLPGLFSSILAFLKPPKTLADQLNPFLPDGIGYKDVRAIPLNADGTDFISDIVTTAPSAEAAKVFLGNLAPDLQQPNHHHTCETPEGTWRLTDKGLHLEALLPYQLETSEAQ